MFEGYPSLEHARRAFLTWAVLAISAVQIAVSASHSTAQGINLSWDDCGLAGPERKTFACDTDLGTPFVLSGSFIPPVDVEQFVGVIAEIGLTGYGGGSVSDWWKFGFPPCRSNVSLLVEGPTSQTCANPYGGVATTSFTYDIASHGVCMTIMVSTDVATVLTPASEYEAFRISIPRTGTSSCGSACNEPTCIGLNWIRLVQSNSAGDVLVSNPANRDYVHWQSLVPGCPPTDSPDWTYGSCEIPTSTNRSTWGQIRQLYR